MFENIINFFKKLGKKQEGKMTKDEAKERLHLVLLQDRANVSADFLEMMKQEIIEVIKKYIDIDENEIDVKLTNKQNSDGTTGAPALYANIPIVAIKSETRKVTNKLNLEKIDKEENKTEKETKNKTKENKKKEENIVEKKEDKKEDKVEEKIEEKVEEKQKDNDKKENESNTKKDSKIKNKKAQKNNKKKIKK